LTAYPTPTEPDQLFPEIPILFTLEIGRFVSPATILIELDPETQSSDSFSSNLSVVEGMSVADCLPKTKKFVPVPPTFVTPASEKPTLHGVVPLLTTETHLVTYGNSIFVVVEQSIVPEANGIPLT
jgi:hypothetical protein